MTQGQVVLAHASLVEAIPFVLPALLVIALLGAVVWRDRRLPDDELTEVRGEHG